MTQQSVRQKRGNHLSEKKKKCCTDRKYVWNTVTHSINSVSREMASPFVFKHTVITRPACWIISFNRSSRCVTRSDDFQRETEIQPCCKVLTKTTPATARPVPIAPGRQVRWTKERSRWIGQVPNDFIGKRDIVAQIWNASASYRYSPSWCATQLESNNCARFFEPDNRQSESNCVWA